MLGSDGLVKRQFDFSISLAFKHFCLYFYEDYFYTSQGLDFAIYIRSSVNQAFLAFFSTKELNKVPCNISSRYFTPLQENESCISKSNY